MQSPLLYFESSVFPVEPGEDEETNPGIFGKSLAHWLAERIATRGFIVEDVFAEDFGWCVAVQSRPHRLYIACASRDDNPQRWGVFVFAEGGWLARLVGKDKRSESIAALYTALKELLESAPEISDLRVEEI